MAKSMALPWETTRVTPRVGASSGAATHAHGTCSPRDVRTMSTSKSARALPQRICILPSVYRAWMRPSRPCAMV